MYRNLNQISTPPRLVTVKDLVINWHICERCNYGCEHCFAKYGGDPKGLVVTSRASTTKLLRELWGFFRPNNPTNPLRDRLAYSSARLTIAGGEPMIHAKHLPHVLDTSSALGFKNALITNGSVMPARQLDAICSRLEWLGISIDALDPEMNRKIGRITDSGKLLDFCDLQCRLDQVRERHPSLCLKINTVVNEHNCCSDLSDMIEALQPDKWKILRVLPNVNPSCTISDEEFRGFVERHQKFAHIASVEDNQDMTQTYIMIDPRGRFFQNGSTCTPYAYSDPILDVGIDTAWAQVQFSPDGFAKRY